MTAAPGPQWFKSSYSGGSGTECVECARIGTGMSVRDSKHRDGGVVTVTSPAWQALVDALGNRALGQRPNNWQRVGGYLPRW